MDIDNHTLLPVKISGAAVVLRGEKSGYSPTGQEVSLDPITLPARQVSHTTLHIHRNSLNPDRYQGSIRLKVENSDDPVKVNATIEVRYGPILPLLVILLGVVVGRLALAMQTPEAQMQMRLFGRYHSLFHESQEVKNPDARAKLDEDLQEIYKQINLANKTESELTKDLDKIEAFIDFMVRLEGLEAKVRKLEDDDAKQRLLGKLESARQKILAGKIDEAKPLLKEVEDDLSTASRQPAVAAEESRLMAALNRLDRIYQAPSMAPWWGPRVMAWLAGTQITSLELKYWLLRPLLFLLLLVLLSLAGLKALYVDGGSIFGASGIYDFLGLFLWGLSADVAQRTLQNIQLSK